MNSIDQHQPEHNHENLVADKAIEKIKSLVGKAGTCFFCTSMITGVSNGARPMNVQKVDEDGCLWFLVAKDSHTVNETGIDPRVKLYFQASSHTDFMELYGKAFVHNDRSMIKELWKPALKTWFTEGENDERIAVIKFVPYSGY